MLEARIGLQFNGRYFSCGVWLCATPDQLSHLGYWLCAPPVQLYHLGYYWLCATPSQLCPLGYPHCHTQFISLCRVLVLCCILLVPISRILARCHTSSILFSRVLALYNTLLSSCGAELFLSMFPDHEYQRLPQLDFVTPFSY